MKLDKCVVICVGTGEALKQKQYLVLISYYQKQHTHFTRFYRLALINAPFIQEWAYL